MTRGCQRKQGASSSRLERAYKSFVRCHRIVASATDEDQLLRDVCAMAVNDLGFKLAWIGAVNPYDQRVVAKAQAGYETGYVDSLLITIANDKYGKGPTGTAMRECHTSVAQNIATDELFEPWRANALKRGYGSSAAIPLCRGGECLGVLNLYAAEPNAFDADEIALLEEMSVDLVMGMLRIRHARRTAENATLVERAASAEVMSLVAAQIAHDVNNLLSVILYSAEYASECEDATTRKAEIAELMRATQSASAMMRQLLAVSRRGAPEVEEVEPDRLVTTVQPLLVRLAPRATLDVKLAAAGAHVRMVPLDLERILINLVINAEQAMTDGGTISLSTCIHDVGSSGEATLTGRLAAGGYVAVVIEDTGAGIADEVLPRIFDPFFTTKGEAGTGLGLASALGLARAAGGDVSVVTRKGKGTRVLVFLPLAASAARGVTTSLRDSRERARSRQRALFSRS